MSGRGSGDESVWGSAEVSGSDKHGEIGRSPVSLRDTLVQRYSVLQYVVEARAGAHGCWGG